MKTAVAIVLLTLSSPASAQQCWSLSCAVDPDGNGFSIYATNSCPAPLSCTASCTVANSDGTANTVSCTTAVLQGAQNTVLCGAGPSAPGRPP